MATSSNDAEVQSLAVGEDVGFRLRQSWRDLKGEANLGSDPKARLVRMGGKSKTAAKSRYEASAHVGAATFSNKD